MPKVKTLLATLLTVALALSGCVAEEEDPAPTTAPPVPTSSPTPEPALTSSPTATATVSPAPVPNEAPTATLSATVHDSHNVTFQVDGADADGDALVWELDVEGDGEVDFRGDDLPDEVDHTYDEVGVHNATLVVSDGEDEGRGEVTVRLEAPGVEQTVESSWSVGAAGCGAPYAVFEQDLPAAGLLYGEFAVDAATRDLPYEMTMELNETQVSGAIAFYNGTGDHVGGQTVEETGDVVFQGLVPEDAVFAVLTTCGPEGATARYVAGTDVNPPPE